jgi:hypothetical protein
MCSVGIIANGGLSHVCRHVVQFHKPLPIDCGNESSSLMEEKRDDAARDEQNQQSAATAPPPRQKLSPAAARTMLSPADRQRPEASLCCTVTY